MKNITNGNGSATAALTPRSVPVLDGRGIANRHPDKRRRAVLAAELADGRAILQLSVIQLAELLDVSREYIRAARRLTPEKRRAILSGEDCTSFAALNGPSDEALIQLARSVGPERLFSAIERVL
jgi:hypothetical protein